MFHISPFVTAAGNEMLLGLSAKLHEPMLEHWLPRQFGEAYEVATGTPWDPETSIIVGGAYTSKSLPVALALSILAWGEQHRPHSIWTKVEAELRRRINMGGFTYDFSVQLNTVPSNIESKRSRIRI